MSEPVSVELKPEIAGVMPPAKPPAEAPPRPQWLPEKFKTPEDLARSYTELEKKFSQTNQKATEVPPAEPLGDKTPPSAPTELGTVEKEALAKAGLNLNDLEAEFTKQGKLSDESIQKLKDAGIDQSRLDAYQRGRQAQEEDFERAVVKDIKGGREALGKALEWASESLTPEDITAFNDTMSSGNKASAALAAAGLLSRYNQAQGPQLIDGSPIANLANVYDSRAQIHADMADARYKSDPAFRSVVEQKILRSNPKH